MPQNIVTCLGFKDQAEEAVNFYTSVIPNSKILSVSRCGDGAPLPKGTLLAATFTLDGQEFMALNGGAPFGFSPGMSIVVRCDTQAEIDRLWDALSEGGAPVQCGWLTDRYGVSWQVVPKVLGELISGDPGRAERVMRALLQMQKLDITALEAAHAAA